MIVSLWNEISFLPTIFKAWRKRKSVGITRKGYTKIYDYTKRK